MPVIVILSDCPPKLRGDMSKWFFEVNTGVYVGNFSARVRENLWARITENIGRGHATMVYSSSGEQRMDFRVHNAYWEPVNFDGIKLMRRPKQREISSDEKIKEFSNASRYRRASTHPRGPNVVSRFCVESYITLDFETTGLNAAQDEIIEIAALFVDHGKIAERMQILIRSRKPVPDAIVQLTGISDNVLEAEGRPEEDGIRALLEFSEDFPIVCHNAAFEKAFLQEACRRIGEKADNRFIDTLEMAQLLLPAMDNHKLCTLADTFGISHLVRHRAMADCEVTNAVYMKLKELAFLEKQKSEK